MDIKRLKPGTHKLMQHTEHLDNIKKGNPVGPIHISVWPMGKCNLHCSYCCGRNVSPEEKEGELDINDFINLIDVGKKYGLKAIELSGICGEPLLWHSLVPAVNYAKEQGLSLSLITNGTLLNQIDDAVISKFDWIRASIQNRNHFNMINWSRLNKLTKASASYIVTQSNIDTLDPIYLYAQKWNIPVRIACEQPNPDEFISKVKNIAENYGEPFFFSYKEVAPPLACYMAYMRAAVDWHGNFLACPSVTLVGESLGYIEERFKLCHIGNLESWILQNSPKDLGFRCSFCNCGYENNNYIHDMLEPLEDVDFV